MNCKKVKKLIRNLTLVVFKKLGNSRNDGGKSETLRLSLRFLKALAFFYFFRIVNE